MKNLILALFVLGSGQGLFAQNKTDLTGSWSLVSIENIYPDGKKVRPYGNNPKGLLLFDGQGNYAIQILKANRPKIASGDKNKCTPEEYASIVKGTNSHFGTFEENGPEGTLSFHIKHASFPNWEGTSQLRNYTLKDNVLKYAVTQTTQGGSSVIAEVTWQRNETIN